MDKIYNRIPCVISQPILCMGFHTKIPKTRWLKSRNSFLTVLELEVQNPGVSKFGVSCGFFPWLADHRFLLCLPSLWSQHLVSLLHFIGTLVYWVRTPLRRPHLTLITSLKFLSPNIVILYDTGVHDFKIGIWEVSPKGNQP